MSQTSYRIRPILCQNEVHFLIEENVWSTPPWRLLSSWGVQEGERFVTLAAAEAHLLEFLAAKKAIEAPTVYYDPEGKRQW